MTNSDGKSKLADDHFVSLLAEKHEQLIAAENYQSDLSERNETDDERVQSALQVLQLLEQVKSAPGSSPEFQVSLETQNDPSTKKPAHQALERSKSQSIETVIPDLERLGRFEIIEQIGRGGFGIVVRARDPQLDRDVAIKIPRFEAALSPESRLRFEREAKAAAALNHPGIVSVFEFGSEQGIAFIVSELIDGENLATCLARGETYSPREAVELVSQLADALEHAHQRGVLHRDVKPSNILLPSNSQGVPRPLIGDFGLAVVSDQQDFTQTGAVIGTPAYMSPEQAAGDKKQIGPTTDVYGLGAILYELLTGQPPFAALPLVEMLDAINRRDPELPRSLNPTIPKDVEAICLKCLEKTPGQRYHSAQDLQADLQRFSNDTPVLARRVNFLNRSLRRIRRNPVLAFVASLSVLFLLCALVASLWGWHSTSAALERERQAKNDARETVNRYFTEVAENDLLNVPGLMPLRKKLLSSALEYYQGFLNDVEADEELMEELELAHFRVGKIQADLGQYSAAIGAFENAQEVQDQMLLENDGDPRLLARRFELFRHLGQTQNQLGKYEFGKVSLDLSVAGFQELIEEDPGENTWHYQLSRALNAKANMMRDKGEFAQAIQLDDQVIDLLEVLESKQPEDRNYLRDLAGTYMDRANALAKNGELGKSVESLDLAIQILRGLLITANPTPQDMNTLAMALFNRAGKHLVSHEAEQAQPLLEEAAEMNDHLVVMFPNAMQYQQTRLSILNGLGFCYSRRKLTDKVVEVLGESIETLEYLRTETPENPRIIYDLGVAKMNLGSTLAQQSDDSEVARGLMMEAEENLTEFLTQSPDFFQARMANAMCQLNLAAVCNQTNEYNLALRYADRSIESMESINSEKPGIPQIVQNLAGAYHNRADALEYSNRWAEAVPVWRIAVDRGGPFKIRSELRLATALASSGELVESKRILDSLADDKSCKARFGGSLGRAQAAMAKARLESGVFEQAEIDSLLNQAVESIRIWFEKPEHRKLSYVNKIRTQEVYQLLLQRSDFQQLLDEVTESELGVSR